MHVLSAHAHDCMHELVKVVNIICPSCTIMQMQGTCRVCALRALLVVGKKITNLGDQGTWATRKLVQMLHVGYRALVSSTYTCMVTTASNKYANKHIIHRCVNDNSGRAWASPEYMSNIWRIRCTYVCMYVAICHPRANSACAICLRITSSLLTT